MKFHFESIKIRAKESAKEFQHKVAENPAISVAIVMSLAIIASAALKRYESKTLISSAASSATVEPMQPIIVNIGRQ